MSVVGDIVRGLICAQSGCRLIAADFSGVESRITAWLSGQQSKLDQWVKFDRTQDPKDEPYYLIGRSSGIAEENARAIGKTADLAFGYAGGIGAWRKLAPDDNSTDDQTVVFMDNSGGKWTECRNGLGMYGGVWLENAVQAVARDLFAAAMPRLEAAGYRIVLHVHDEIVAEVAEDFGTAEEFLKILHATGMGAGVADRRQGSRGPQVLQIEGEACRSSCSGRASDSRPLHRGGSGKTRTNRH
jgi:hypothetical protein